MVQSLFLNNDKQKQIWTSHNNFGDITLKEFEKLNSDEQNKIKEFLLDSYVCKNINVNSQKVHLVHAKSIQEKNDNSNKTLREMLAEGKELLVEDAVWLRSSDGKKPHEKSAKDEIFTVIGHSPTKDHMIKYQKGYLNVDCGCGGMESASLVNLTKGVVKYFNVMRENLKEFTKNKGR